jgi:Putative Zn-dependent protease, contains TPR repeats
MDKKIANLYGAGEVDKAIHLLVERINRDPKDIENYLQLSTYLIEQNAADQALELLEKARGLVNHPEELTYNIAVCYYLQGKFQKSLALLNSIKDDEETMYQKALIFMKLGQYQKALAYALTLKNQDERTLELLGDIWLSLGDLKTANQTYSQILKDQRNSKINFLLGLTLFDTNPNEAEKYFKLSKNQDPKYFAQAQKQYNAVAKLIRGKNDKN